MKTPHITPSRSFAFSLVEVLAAVAIIAIITFLAIPNIVQVKKDGEDGLARARADALNMATSAYFQSVGIGVAKSAWSGKTSEQRYSLIKTYLSFAPSTLSDFVPAGYDVTFDANNPHMIKATLKNSGGTTIAY